jgi:bacillithiol biosynthesis cysteine-adding enzyme BshC
MIRAISRPIGGSPLARSALGGDLPEWYGDRLSSADAWTAAASRVADDFRNRSWLSDLLPAFHPSGVAAERLGAASESGGLVVTGGQQPGLFGGPLYVLHKAVTLIEMADALASLTGRPVAPVFWAATDDADFVEANHVSVVRHGRLELLAMAADPTSGRSMANTPLGDVTEQLERLAEACGSAPDQSVLDAVRRSYHTGATVGSSYVTLLRALLEPLGVAVLDASHPSVRGAGRDVIVRALGRADEVAAALRARSMAIVDAGFHPQVADVPNLSLVFETLEDGTRRRVPLRAAQQLATDGDAARMGPNVLLRPVMERHLLPTVTYVGGPGEVAYFAQVSAVAGSLGMATPRISPRWSGTLLEEHIDAMLTRLGATIADFADPHAIESRIAREAISEPVRDAMTSLRRALDSSTDAMRRDVQTNDALSRSVGTMRAGVEHRLERLERRYAAAIKQSGSERLRDVATVRATLFPGGSPQERVLSFIPFLARYGDAAVDAAREQARLHVARMINGG